MTQKTQKSTSPDFVVKTSKGYGKAKRLDRIGVAWSREKGGLCIRLSGTQVIAEDLYVFPINSGEPESA